MHNRGVKHTEGQGLQVPTGNDRMARETSEC